jgi:hypothetical protein
MRFFFAIGQCVTTITAAQALFNRSSPHRRSLPIVASQREFQMTTTEMTTTEIRELNLAELDQVSGAAPDGWKYCEKGATGGGGPGLYPLYVVCK